MPPAPCFYIAVEQTHHMVDAELSIIACRKVSVVISTCVIRHFALFIFEINLLISFITFPTQVLDKLIKNLYEESN